jgi:peptidoglycan-N-acetylglucosamine deacetylase
LIYRTTPLRLLIGLIGGGIALAIASIGLAQVNSPREKKPKIRSHHSIAMAVTIDDLPGGGPETGEYTHARIVNDIIAVLRAHKVTRPTGFVVGSMLEGRPERRAAVDAWVNAGFWVGNHTYSHSALAEVGLDAYVADIEKNRAVVDALEKSSGQKGHFFRYPYLEEGRTDHERRTLARLLTRQHDTLARVSLDFGDWAWAEPYQRCMERGDQGALDLLAQSYLENAVAYLVWSVAAAREVVERAAPQVLLLHANVATALNLDALLTAFEKVGVRYISLAQALSDPAYTAKYETSGGTVFVQASQHLGRPHPPYLVRPLSLLDLACR